MAAPPRPSKGPPGQPPTGIPGGKEVASDRRLSLGHVASAPRTETQSASASTLTAFPSCTCGTIHIAPFARGEVIRPVLRQRGRNCRTRQKQPTDGPGDLAHSNRPPQPTNTDRANPAFVTRQPRTTLIRRRSSTTGNRQSHRSLRRERIHVHVSIRTPTAAVSHLKKPVGLMQRAGHDAAAAPTAPTSRAGAPSPPRTAPAVSTVAQASAENSTTRHIVTPARTRPGRLQGRGAITARSRETGER